MNLEELMALVRRRGRQEAPAAGSAEFERIYASSLDRALGEPLGAPSPRRDWRRVPWPVTAGLVVAVLALALFLPLPRVHLGSTTTSSAPSTAGSCAAGAGGSSVVFMVTSTGDAPAEEVMAMEVPAGKLLWTDHIPALLYGVFNPPVSEDLQVSGVLAVALAPGGSVLYVAVGEVAPTSRGDTAVSALLALSAGSGELEHAFPVPSLSPRATGLAISPDGDVAYVAESGGAGGRPGVVPVNLESGTAGAPIHVEGDPVAIAFSPDGRTAFVTTGEGLTLIDVATRRPEATIGIAAGAIAVSPSGDTALVGNLENNPSLLAPTLTVVDLPQRRLEIPVHLVTPYKDLIAPDEPRSVEVTCDGSEAYVAMPFGIERVDIVSRTVTLVEQAGGGSLLLPVLAAGEGAAGDLWIAAPQYTTCSARSCAESAPMQLEYIRPSSDLTSRPVATVPGIVSQMVVAPSG